MTDSNFSRPGAVDLSDLAQSAATTGGSRATYVMEAAEADFQALATNSTRYPIIVEFYSPRDTGGQATASALADAVNAADGKFLLARVNVDTQQQFAASIGVQAVPTVVALIGGQLAPLFQGTKSAAEIQQVLTQIGQVAVANGMTGRAEPVGMAEGDGDAAAEPPSDPRFEPADDALAAGDYAKAVAEFDKLLKETPNDAEVIAGRAQASLLARSLGFDAAQVQAKAADADDLDAQLDMADFEIIQGDADRAFDRLLSLAARSDAETKEAIRVRLLELFEVVGRTDPQVLKARRRLSTVLF